MKPVLERLKESSKVNGAYPKDIADAITELESNEEIISNLTFTLDRLKEVLYNLDLDYLYDES